ncbi:HTTM domain-containing protein [Chitinophaga sp. S165]|uniref:HTTM domain-containing protein n=1 Tax=Chitinophaga sp. S165 TaxID=2135462 RepID=UPI000D718519|nr:HTTM domain-containing protein [Chitinophaga sp. S165]PWV54525.1 vitamin K-dependent gamma-carboxylase-like protein [Chitinophaga sp. S165]
MLASLKRFFLTPSTGEPLAFFRIGIALLGLVQGGWLAGSITLLYGSNGLVPWSISNGIVDAYMPQLSWLQPLVSVTGMSADAWVYLLMGIYLFSLGVLLLGKFTRYAAFVAWALQFTFINTGFMGAYGVETFMHIALFYCITMPVGEVFSWDTFSRSAAPVATEWNTLSIRVLQLHLCVVYIASGAEKAMGIQWWNGEAIWQTLMQGQFARFDMRWMANYPLLAKVIGWGTLLLETGYPFFIWWRRTRPYGYLAIVLMHMGIAVFMGLQLFSGIMIIFNTAAFGWPYLQHAYRSIVLPLREKKRLQRAGQLATQAFWNHFE